MVKNWKNLGQATKCATFLSGALLVTVPVYAQVAPIGDAPYPAPIAASQAAAVQPTIDLEFENIQVVELLKVIAKTCKIGVLINEDVSGILAYVNINAKSPEEALQYVARNAGLKVRRETDGTYQISKSLVEGAANTINSAPPVGITPANNGFGGGLVTPSDNSALPQLGTEASTFGNSTRSRQGSLIDTLPELVSVQKPEDKRANGSTPIRIKNVKASIMAYWLDPANNPVPTDFLVSQSNAEEYTKKNFARPALSPEDQASISGIQGFAGPNHGLGNVVPSPYLNPYVANRVSNQIAPEVRSNFQFGGFGGNQGRNQGRNQTGGSGRNNSSGSFELPGEIERIVAIDPQNVIMVAGGTQADIEALQRIIDVLDKPLRQVEIEAQFVELTAAESKNFGIDFSSSRGNFDFSTNSGFNQGGGPAGIQVGFVRGNFQATLKALASQNRVKVVTAPRVTAINNLTALIESSSSTPVTLTTAAVGGGVGGGVAQGQSLMYITTSIGLNVTPTINGDDTITVLMQPQLESQGISGDVSGAPTISTNRVETVANVKDGDTIALGGLKSNRISRGITKIPLLGDIPGLGKLFQSRSTVNTEVELIIFVTARIVRRADEDFVVPGT
jgi:type II secretory pathway component GspD/PulD (secretin)